ncbi:family 43 glycosylhydrolase [Lachnospiraceae bacterium 29-84]
MKKKILAGILAFAMVFGMAPDVPQDVQAADPEPKEIVLDKSTQGNPIAGFDEKGELIYAGDPAILVDGDTVYLYVGHDATAGGGSYQMPNYLCYSTQDLKEWRYEGVTMEMTDVTWADNVSAWASQVIKYQGKYYLLYCAEKPGTGKCVGAAVSDSPTGPFRDIGAPLVYPNDTNAQKYGRKASFPWEDIDPTAWIDTDENGEEHVYMAWGNSNCWMCELDIDGDSVKVMDQNKDGKILQEDDIWWQNVNGIEVIPSNGTNQNDMVDFTEAPYLYRRQDENGNYYGKYYLFFAMHWREEMGYATADSLTNPNGAVYNTWQYGGKLMEPTATSDTNHPAVFDFKGHTYFIYHNGSLAGGMGQRRVICIEEMKFREDGSIEYIQETSTGLTGVTSKLMNCYNEPVAHEKFNNSINSNQYPYMNVPVVADSGAERADMLWEIEQGKADKSNASYVTIESYNKPGLYLMATEEHKVVLAHDHNGNTASNGQGITSESDAMTFRTLEGSDADSVIFESVKYPGWYLASGSGEVTLTQDIRDVEAAFRIAHEDITAFSARKTKRTYEVGETVNVNDVRALVSYDDGTSKTITSGFTTNAASIRTSKPGTVNLTVSYTERDVTKTANISIQVVEKTPAGKIDDIDITPVQDVPKKNTARTIGNLKYKVTKSDGYNTDGSNGTVTVTGVKSSKLTSVKIPDEVTIDGYTFKVTAIASKAFQNKSKLKTITIGNNVKSIGSKAISGIHKKATIKIPSARYKAVKKLLNSKAGYKKTMKLKKIK